MFHSPWLQSVLKLLGVSLLCLACGGAAGPEDVASSFWAALREGRIDEARAVALPIDAGRLHGLVQRHSITAVELGEPEEDADTATVETTLPAPHGDASFAFPTHLTRVEGEWRVDAQKTLGSMRQALITSSLEQAGEALRDSGRIFGEALGRGAQDATAAIEEALEEFSRSLEGGLEGSTPPPEPTPPAGSEPRPDSRGRPL